MDYNSQCNPIYVNIEVSPIVSSGVDSQENVYRVAAYITNISLHTKIFSWKWCNYLKWSFLKISTKSSAWEGERIYLLYLFV